MLKRLLTQAAIGLSMLGTLGIANATLYEITSFADYRGFEVNGYILLF